METTFESHKSGVGACTLNHYSPLPHLTVNPTYFQKPKQSSLVGQSHDSSKAQFSDWFDDFSVEDFHVYNYFCAF